MGAGASVEDIFSGCFTDETIPVNVSKLRAACPRKLLVRFDAAMVGRSELTRLEADKLMAKAALEPWLQETC